MNKQIEEVSIYFPVGITEEGIVTARIETARGYFSLCTDVHYPFVFDASEDVRDFIDSVYGTDSEEGRENIVKWAESLGFSRDEYFETFTDDETGEEITDEEFITDQMVDAAIDRIVEYFDNNEAEKLELLHDCSCAHGTTVMVDGEEYNLESISGGQHDPREDDGFVPYDKVPVVTLYDLWDRYHLKNFDTLSESDLNAIRSGIKMLEDAGFSKDSRHDLFSYNSEYLTAMTKQWLDAGNR